MVRKVMVLQDFAIDDTLDFGPIVVVSLAEVQHTPWIELHPYDWRVSEESALSWVLPLVELVLGHGAHPQGTHPHLPRLCRNENEISSQHLQWMDLIRTMVH